MPSLLSHVGCGPAKIDCVPVHDGADDQVEARSTECLAVKGAVTDFSALVEKDGAFQLMGGLTLVETGLASPP